jgi:branched-chain amino acid transport system substrate-binding protein
LAKITFAGGQQMNFQREIIVGLTVSLSGKFSYQGLQALHGIGLWRDYANANGGIEVGSRSRRPVRLIFYDDQSRVEGARQNSVRLLEDDHIDVLFGPYSSALTLAAAQVAEEHRKILWNPGGTSDAIFDHGWRYLVSIASPASDYLRDLPSWLAKTMPSLRRVCIVYSRKGTFASQVVRGMVEAAEVVGSHSVTTVPVDTPLGEDDALVRELCSISPDVLVFAQSFQDEIRLIKARHLWPGSVKAVAAVAAGLNAFYDIVGEAAEGVMAPSQWEHEDRFLVVQGPSSNWFISNFQDRYGSLPEYTAAGAFAAGLILTQCVLRPGSLEDEELRQEVAGLDLNTFYGKFRIDARTGRQIGHRILLTQWRQGRKVVIS